MGKPTGKKQSPPKVSRLKAPAVDEVKAEKEAKAEATKGSQPTFDLPVEFGGVRIGAVNARIGIAIAKGHGGMTITNAERMLLNSRCAVKVTLDGNAAGDIPGQAVMDIATSEHVIEAVADIKGWASAEKSIKFGLTFQKADVDMKELSQFSGGSGKLVCTRTGEVPKKAKDYENGNPAGNNGSDETEDFTEQ